MRTFIRQRILFLLSAASFLAGKAQEATRIVSLAPSVTATLQQLGADRIIVGRTTYCPAAQDGKPYVTIGNVLETNIEKIIALKPDLVFGMAFTKDETLEKLKALGIKVRNFPTPADFEEICSQTLEIGSLAGYGRQAKALVESEKAKVESLRAEFRQSHPLKSAPRVFFQIGDRPVFPVIEGTFMNQYLTFLGLENIVKEYKGGGISREYVVAADPDLMLISKMSGTGQEAADYWKKFKDIRAVQNGHVVLVDDTMACCPTPVFFRKTLQFIASYLRKM